MNDKLYYLYQIMPTRTYLVHSGNDWNEIKQMADDKQHTAKWYERYTIVNANNTTIYKPFMQNLKQS